MLGATYCVRLATLLRRVAKCWVMSAQIWKWSNFSCNIVYVAWCCDRLAKFMQQYCAWASALFRFNSQQQGGQTRATCCARQCCDLLYWNAAIVWPELANAGPTMLGYVVLICCDRFGRYLMHLWREHLNGFEWCGRLVRLSLCV